MSKTQEAQEAIEAESKPVDALAPEPDATQIARGQLVLESAAVAGQLAYLDALMAALARDRHALLRRQIEIELATKDAAGAQ